MRYRRSSSAAADETALFGKHGEDEVGMALGQEGHLALGPLAEALAGKLAGTDGDLRLVRVVAAPQRIDARIDEGLDPVLLIGLELAPDLVADRRHEEHGRRRGWRR